jgi:hypothetical protein
MLNTPFYLSLLFDLIIKRTETDPSEGVAYMNFSATSLLIEVDIKELH